MGGSPSCCKGGEGYGGQDFDWMPKEENTKTEYITKTMVEAGSEDHQSWFDLIYSKYIPFMVSN